MHIEPVESARITVIIDNHVDMLLTDSENVKRFGLMQHFIPPHGEPVCTENGISYWIELRASDGRDRRVLFDTGLTSTVLLHNLRALGLSPDQVDHAVISHAHPDHFGGLIGFLKERRYPLPIAVNPDAFLPKYFVGRDGEKVMRLNRGFERSLIEREGGVIVEASGPVEVGSGTLATGFIPRTVPFEPPVPAPDGTPAGAYIDREGTLVNDDAVVDDQAVVIHVKDKGLVVMTACGHAGVINSVRHAQKITGVTKVHAVMGGFHTGFPGVPQESGNATIDALREFEPQIVAPMHCTGIRTIALALNAFPGEFLHNVVGTTLMV